MTRFLVYFTAYFALILFQLDSISAIPPRKSLFIQVNGWPTGISGLTALLDNVCLYHRNASGSLQYIENLVLDQIAIYDVNANSYANPPDNSTNDILITSYIDAFLPYFPGGDAICQLDNVFVGTFGVGSCGPNVTGYCDPYSDGIKNESWRWNLILRQRNIAQQFVNHLATTKYAGLVYFSWYLNQEGALDEYVDSSVNAATDAYLGQHIADLNSIMGPRTMLWSPFFSSTDPNGFLSNTTQKAQLTQNLGILFGNLNNYTNGSFWLAQQDGVGATSCYPQPQTMQSATTWFYYLTQFNFTYFAMNVELFMLNCTGPWTSNGYYPAPTSEIIAREAYYQQNGIYLGPAFEIRYWEYNSY